MDPEQAEQEIPEWMNIRMGLDQAKKPWVVASTPDCQGSGSKDSRCKAYHSFVEQFDPSRSIILAGSVEKESAAGHMAQWQATGRDVITLQAPAPSMLRQAQSCLGTLLDSVTWDVVEKIFA